ncbi:hypothetical protein [Streptomyces sp.]|uniref:hypothetical protein n=1 Tax=Streptomyces sp. TaxID=1931 RepID=UPI002F92FC3B
MTVRDDRGATCPSSSCAPGRLLLGIVRPDGTVAALRDPLEVDSGFVEQASADGRRPPEARFRFAGPCVTSSCAHWAEERCSLGDAVARVGASTAGHTALAPCAIRSSCRWWEQGGPEACAVCPHIVHTTSAPAAVGG